MKKMKLSPLGATLLTVAWTLVLTGPALAQSRLNTFSSGTQSTLSTLSQTNLKLSTEKSLNTYQLKLSPTTTYTVERLQTVPGTDGLQYQFDPDIVTSLRTVAGGPECKDGSECPSQSCQTATCDNYRCKYTPIAGCCASVADCNNSDPDKCAVCVVATYTAAATSISQGQCYSANKNDAATYACCSKNEDCDDGNPCTTDACNTGSVPISSQGALSYSLSAGVCTHTPVNTADTDACTQDSCDPTEGVRHTPIPNCCTPNTAATACNDNDQCTTDSCVPTGTSASAGYLSQSVANSVSYTCQHTSVTPSNCSTICGSGVRTCSNNTWSTCSAPLPLNCTNYNTCRTEPMCGITACPAAPAETCDGVDNDCDGQVDEGVTNACMGCGPLTGTQGTTCDGNGDGCPGGTLQCSTDKNSLTCQGDNSVVDDNNACTTDACTATGGVTHTDITTCAGGDGCCPTRCNSTNDSDCSASCGNGVTEGTETCDGGNCPTSCDDGLACTTDRLAGSPTTCNVSCTHADITSCTGGDGCCPTGCNATNDSDCQSSCGNGVVEGGEACDGGDLGGKSCTDLRFDSGTLGCNADCTLNDSLCLRKPVCQEVTCPGSVTLGATADCQVRYLYGDAFTCTETTAPVASETSLVEKKTLQADSLMTVGTGSLQEISINPLRLESRLQYAVKTEETTFPSEYSAYSNYKVMRIAEIQPEGTVGDYTTKEPVNADTVVSCTVTGPGGASDPCSTIITTGSCGVDCSATNPGKECTAGNDCSCSFTATEGANCMYGGETVTTDLLGVESETSGSKTLSASCTGMDATGTLFEFSCSDTITVNPTCDSLGFEIEGDVVKVSCAAKGATKITVTYSGEQKVSTSPDSCSDVSFPYPAGVSNPITALVEGEAGSSADDCDAVIVPGPTCRNGQLEPGEECDPDTSDTDKCVDCRNVECGDGVTQGAEECDDGVASNTCSADCKITSCGDGIVNRVGEECDDGNQVNNDGCTGACLEEKCGDGVVNGTEICDGNCLGSCDDGVACTEDTLSGSPTTCDVSCTHATVISCNGGDGCCPTACNSTNDNDCQASCGNGVTEGGETCEPPNTATCDASCQVIPTTPPPPTASACGNGNPEEGEECDYGTANSDTGPSPCTSQCVIKKCGDGVVNTEAEECDPPNGETCSPDCRTIVPSEPVAIVEEPPVETDACAETYPDKGLDYKCCRLEGRGNAKYAVAESLSRATELSDNKPRRPATAPMPEITAEERQQCECRKPKMRETIACSCVGRDQAETIVACMAAMNQKSEWSYEDSAAVKPAYTVDPASSQVVFTQGKRSTSLPLCACPNYRPIDLSSAPAFDCDNMSKILGYPYLYQGQIDDLKGMPEKYTVEQTGIAYKITTMLPADACKKLGGEATTPAAAAAPLRAIVRPDRPVTALPVRNGEASLAAAQQAVTTAPLPERGEEIPAAEEEEAPAETEAPEAAADMEEAPWQAAEEAPANQEEVAPEQAATGTPPPDSRPLGEERAYTADSGDVLCVLVRSLYPCDPDGTPSIVRTDPETPPPQPKVLPPTVPAATRQQKVRVAVCGWGETEGIYLDTEETFFVSCPPLDRGLLVEGKSLDLYRNFTDYLTGRKEIAALRSAVSEHLATDTAPADKRAYTSFVVPSAATTPAETGAPVVGEAVDVQDFFVNKAGAIKDDGTLEVINEDHPIAKKLKKEKKPGAPHSSGDHPGGSSGTAALGVESIAIIPPGEFLEGVTTPDEFTFEDLVFGLDGTMAKGSGGMSCSVVPSDRHGSSLPYWTILFAALTLGLWRFRSRRQRASIKSFINTHARESSTKN